MGELKERFLSVYNNAVHRDGSDMLLRWLEDSCLLYTSDAADD